MEALNDRNPTVARAAANALEHLTGSAKGGADWDAIESALIDRILTDEQRARLDRPAAAAKDGPKPKLPEVVVKSVLYGVNGKPQQQIDLTEKVRKLVDSGEFSFSASYQFAGGDPARGIHKTTEIEYTIDGEVKTQSLREGAVCDLLTTISNFADSNEAQDVQLAIEALGHVGGDNGKKAIRIWLTDNPKGELRVMMAAMRSLGYLQDSQATADLGAIVNANLGARGKGGWNEGGFNQKPTYLAATAIEAMGRIGTVEAENAILAAMPKFGNFETHVIGTGEHGWLRSAQASPIYFRALEALDRMQSEGAGPMAGALVESIPVDKDRGLLYELDSYEKLVGRVIQRSGQMDAVVEACFQVLGEELPEGAAKVAVDPKLIASVSKAPHNERHIRRHSAQARAAQVMSTVCNDLKYASRIRAVLLKYRAAEPSETRSWCCFMLTRTLGRLGDADSIDLFVEMLEEDPTEASLGLNPPPTHIIYKAWRPFYRPAAAWSLGELKTPKAVPILMHVLTDLDNAPSTREQAAEALGKIGDKSCLDELTKLAEEYPDVMTRRAILRSVKRISE